MKIVIAPDSYKESLSAAEVAQAIEKGFREIFPDAQYVSVPVADGGEGTVEAMIAATQGVERAAWVTGPLGEKVKACWGMSGDGKTAFIEMAAASGLALVPPEKRNPLITTSRGTGELILQALESGASNIIHCLSDIDISELDPRLKLCAIRVACDVSNPLIGDNGASRIFGPQKGATEENIVELDRNLAHYADIIKKSLNVDVKAAPGAGAAGGMGAALMAFLGAELRSGIEIVTAALNLEEHIHDCTLVVTGEGRIDSQSIRGKVPIGVANVAKKYHKPVIGIAGSLTHDVGIVHHYGIDAVFSVLTRIVTLEEAFRGAFDNIYRASRNVAAALAIGMRSAG
ncbi:TPA: glycerate kinase [Salmonella enterica]|nr:glycerate kinase [Salmonella enterica]HEA0231592.1 glycerate kinase [Salmonella enterica]HEA0244671.1 glycerate kinase [Salmonella enterica]